MALPTSTIVLALVTAIPFGLAVRDQITGKGGYVARGEDLDSDADADYERSMRAEREFEERQEKRRAEEKATFEAELPKLLGREPGTTSIAPIDGPASAVDSGKVATLESALRAQIETTARNGKIQTVNVTLRRPSDDRTDPCTLLEERIHAAWGTEGDGVGEMLYRGDDMTSNWAAHTTRASFTESERACTLAFDRMTPVTAVDKTQTSPVPLWALNQPAQKLIALLGADAYSSSTEIRWAIPGIGLGVGETDMHAVVEKGKIVTITADFTATRISARALGDHLAKTFGDAEVSDLDANIVMKWPAAKLSLVEADDGYRFQLVAGKSLPESE